VSELSTSAARFRERMQGLGHEIDVVALADSTRTASEAADTLGCEVAQIAKSIVFRDPAADAPVLVVASGVNRVSIDKLKRLSGLELEQASGGFVKKRLGFAIGGVPPAGHAESVRTFLDEHLKRHDVLWAAAGTPFAVFRLAPAALPELTGADWADVAE
jgi:prolyl-tRNA editing enzyme YbaK/EbsC (Cys-tRNA(Pro) deacylase)